MCSPIIQMRGKGGLVHLQAARFHYWTSAVHLLRVNNSFNIWRLVDLFLGGQDLTM